MYLYETIIIYPSLIKIGIHDSVHLGRILQYPTFSWSELLLCLQAGVLHAWRVTKFSESRVLSSANFYQKIVKKTCNDTSF